MQAKGQIDLFDIDVSNSEDLAEDLTVVNWSFSRRDTLERCPRQYYYEYYASKKNTNKDESRREKVAQLRKIQNRHLRTGEILHLIIRTYFGKLRKGEKWELSRLLNWARDVIRKDREFSKNSGMQHAAKESKFPPTLLLEYYYQTENRESLWDESEEKLGHALTNFFNNPAYEEFRQRATNENAKVEHRFKYKIVQNITVSGQIDLMDVQDKDAIVVDWKIGQGSGENESLQLLSYSMWLRDELSVLPDETRIYQANLNDGEKTSYVVTDTKLSRARVRILQDVQKMAALDKYGVMSEEEAFTPCGQLRLCRMCAFQEICPKV
jgi:RecB family exonuclease